MIKFDDAIVHLQEADTDFNRRQIAAENSSAYLLDTRAKTHGEYERVAALVCELQRETTPEITELPATAHARHMICVKLARIAQGDCNYEDHWRDIAGYATLAADYIKKQRKLAEGPRKGIASPAE